MAEPTPEDRVTHDPAGAEGQRSAEPWTSGQRPSPIPTHSDPNRPAPRHQGVFGWSILAWVVVLAVLGVLFKWSLAGG